MLVATTVGVGAAVAAGATTGRDFDALSDGAQLARENSVVG
jgi:hypothetical protein